MATEIIASTSFMQKLTSIAKWKKVLIISSAVVVLLVGYGFGMYILGANSCARTTPPSVEKDESKDKGKVYPPVDKNSICGTKINMTASIDKYKANKLTLKIFGQDKCKEYTSYFDVNWTCPNPKWSVALGLGALISYDSIGKKFYPQVGGLIGFQRHWGNVSLGPEVGVYSTIDKSMFSVATNLKFEYRF
jgi:hypothetical protein